MNNMNKQEKNHATEFSKLLRDNEQIKKVITECVIKGINHYKEVRKDFL